MKGFDINLFQKKINDRIRMQLVRFVVNNIFQYSEECSIFFSEEHLIQNGGTDLFPFKAEISFQNKVKNIIFDNSRRRKNYLAKCDLLVYIEVGKKINMVNNSIETIVLHMDTYELDSDMLLFQYNGKKYVFSKISMDNIDGDEVKIDSKKLYKYKPFEENNFYPLSVPQFTKSAIDNDELYFAPPSSLNDPFECRFDNVLPFVSVTFNVFSSLKEVDKKKHSFKKIYDELIIYFNKYGNYTDFKDYYLSEHKLTDSTDGSLTINPNDYKICALTPHNDEILMWSYYGQEHKGVCLEYNSDEIVKALKAYPGSSFFLYGSVKYDNDRPTYNKLSALYYYLNQDVIINLLIINVLFKKYKKWEHENEFRFVVVDKSSNSGVKINIPITSFYLGCNSNIALVRQLNNSHKFHAPKASIDLTDYKLNF